MIELGTILFIIFFFIAVIACVKWLAGFIGDIEAEQMIKEETEKFNNKDISGGDTDGKEDLFIEFISRTGEDV